MKLLETVCGDVVVVCVGCGEKRCVCVEEEYNTAFKTYGVRDNMARWRVRLG